MKPTLFPLAVCIAASAALAQDEAVLPQTRDEVKSEALSAQKTGEIPKGEANATRQHPKGGAAVMKSFAGETRSEVQAETRAAVRAGEVVHGEAGISARHPQGAEADAATGR